ncbi:linear amide C-N hydrolase [Thermosynechococcaceae cyanobacterium BACA0444]|uniref:Linear amide C-N hydrolase n=1 Tax=Pseudocalidococcus azoricus BACA0444 TaxID=2918990 RepID=A0AAE4FRN9_9CYAN|nr:linear amide C-N hydrolase [Pseudocalidococcus azoricus]MDS3860915.1 linear amide C-N hydrolase [Pseudocalidococcus azoricus BACA0444]
MIINTQFLGNILLIVMLAVTLEATLGSSAAQACTRILWNNNKFAVVVGRTMDWPESTEPILTVFPRGIKRNGGLLGQTRVVTENPAQWTAKYGSLVTTVYGMGTADGLNEQGLGMHMLYLTATDFGPRDVRKPGVQAGLWGQYLLDNAATVKEAIALMAQIQPVMVAIDQMKATVHLAIEDASGDSAILEYINGNLVIHHGPEYRVMTNDPPYDQQLAFLKTWDFTNATRQTPLPGNVDPQDRFVRATYYQMMLPEPKTQQEAIAGILAIARNVSVPFGAPNNIPGSLYNTEYRTAIDLTNRRYFFELSHSPNVIWVDLDKLDLRDEAPVLILDPDNLELSGNVTTKFQQADKIPF